MKVFAVIQVEFEAIDVEEAQQLADEYAVSIEDLPAVVEAWVSEVEIT